MTLPASPDSHELHMVAVVTVHACSFLLRDPPQVQWLLESPLLLLFSNFSCRIELDRLSEENSWLKNELRKIQQELEAAERTKDAQR